MGGTISQTVAQRRIRPPDDVSPELLREATDSLVKLIRRRVPRAWNQSDGFEAVAWPAVAAGFLARAAYLLDSLTTLVERGNNADGTVLLRVLFEHSTTFCWIAIDPIPHMEIWGTWDQWRQKKLHSDALAYNVEVLTQEELDEIGDPPKPAGLPSLAEAVDKHWSQQLSAFRSEGILTFRGFYTSIYRRASSLVHATQAGVDRHTRVTGSQVLILPDEQDVSPPDLHSVGVVMVCFMLLVYADRFAWPDESEVRELADSIFYMAVEDS